MTEDNTHQTEEPSMFDIERKLDRSNGCRSRDQRVLKVKDKSEESRLPTPPPLPDPQCPRFARDRGVLGPRATTSRPDEEEEEEDLVAYLNELGASPVEGHSFDYDTPNSAASAMGVSTGPFAEEAFEHLDRLCALTEQILELRDRSSKHFRRVRGLERVKALRSADRRLETALANDEELLGDFPDEDTGFAESLLDAMLSNCRDLPAQRRNERSSVRSPSSRQRSRSLALTEQTLTGMSNVVDRTDVDKRTARNAVRNGGPKVSKWTRVKAAFKWERACTNDLAEIAESSTTTPSTPTTRYLKIPDVAGSWSGSALSPCTSEISSPSTPIGRVSPTSSSNEEVFDEPRKNIISYPDRQSLQAKDDRKKDDPDGHDRPFDRDTFIAENIDSIELSNEASRGGKPLIRIISDADSTMHLASGSRKDPEVPSKRPTPTLTITIPSNEEEIRSLSSPESTSPLPSSAQDSGGSSPQRPKTRQDILGSREFKRQYSTIEEAITPAPKIQRQDSKWNKVRRAFLTNATFSVPPSPVRVVAARSFANVDTRRARSCSESVEDLGKTVAGTNHCRAEALRDYQALREKFGAEFYRKLLEWERLKSNPPRVLAARNVRDGLPLNEERLAPEFRKKLQDWKRAKKGRRSGASIEQQRVSRRRLTDWQLWRSSSKPEPRCYGKNQNSVSSRGSCASIGSAGSHASDGKQHLCEDFVKRMETWRKMSEAACRNSEKPKPPTSRVASNIIDETEFLALEKLLLLFGQRTRKERRESDAKQLNDCFDGDSRFTATSRSINCGNEVLIRTSVGSYRFEGISREFTRKLYDWEKYRGISPRSSTFRLLGPSYTPFAQDSDEATLTESPNMTGKNRVLHWSLKRSKSDGSVFEDSLRDESYTLRRSTSLHSLISTDKLKDDNRINTLPTSSNRQDIKDHSEDTAIEDSEPEAMIVDIEDVIEETASPLERVQPHQTPVYSVAASETTSIAVPLGTVTSSHEPSPVFLVEAEDDDDDCERWNRRTWIGQEARSSENSPSPERFPTTEDWHERTTSTDEDKASWEPWRKEHDREDKITVAGWTEKMGCSIPDDDLVKSDRPIEWNRDAWNESGEIFQRYTNEENRHSKVLQELPLTPIYESNTDTKQQNFLGIQRKSGNAEPTLFAENLGATSATWDVEKLTDSPRTCKRMNETRKIEDSADEPNNERKSDVKDHQDAENAVKSEKTMANAGSHTYQLATHSDRRNSRETFPNVSNLNLNDNKGGSTECHDADTGNEISALYENLSELQSDVDRHYEILTFKTDTCHDTVDNRFLYEPISCHDNRNLSHSHANSRAKENLSLSKSSDVEKPNLSEIPTSFLIDSTIRTNPITVSRDNEVHCLERILINEETLKKIIVPTSTESGTKSTGRPRDRFANADYPQGSTAISDHDGDHATMRMTEDQVACVKKDGSSSRNVFVKTKRMIFGPFRRSEDRSSSRKESDGSVDDRFLRSKSKSKSRSASPKLCRQDALLRVSLSLPWPLRSTSKESEAVPGAESRRSSGGKTEDVVTVQRRNSRCSEFISDEQGNADGKKPNDQVTNEEPSSAEINQPKTHHSVAKSSIMLVNTRATLETFSPCVFEQPDRHSRVIIVGQDQNTCRMQDEGKCGRTQDEGEGEEQDQVKCSRAQNGEKHDEGRCSERQNEEVKCSRRQDEMRPQDENHVKNDAVPSDLMHKLRILSDVAARREGRMSVTESSSVSSSESHSSRIRRAKESFLSRRGGPFCRSMMEPSEAGGRENNPWRRTFTSQISSPSEIAVSISKSEETEDVRSAIEAITTTPQDEITSSSEDQGCAHQEDRDVGVRADLVKSASAGMINVDPDTFGRLVAVDRGCESLPRTIAKRRDSSGPLAKIVSKLKLSRLIRAKNVDGGNMSTISTLCRQSLMINMQSNSEARREVGEIANDPEEATNDKGKSDDDQVESSETIHE